MKDIEFTRKLIMKNSDAKKKLKVHKQTECAEFTLNKHFVYISLELKEKIVHIFPSSAYQCTNLVTNKYFINLEKIMKKKTSI